MQPLTIIGSLLSPYVRKVLACLVHKGIAFRVDPIVPFYGNAEFSALSPLRRIPVLINERTTLSDSTVICEYLEDAYPGVSMYPPGAEDRARARWLEEFADSRMGDVFIWRYFNQLVIRRFVWGEQPEAEVVRKAQQEEIPAILDYLERELPAQGWLFGKLCVADVAIASFFRNLAFARYQVDAARWPRTAAFVARALADGAFATLAPFEELMLKTPIAQSREALLAAGAPLTDRTWGTATPQRGVMPI